MPGIEVAGNICLRRSRPTKGCRADEDDDNEHGDDDSRRDYKYSSSSREVSYFFYDWKTNWKVSTSLM